LSRAGGFTEKDSFLRNGYRLGRVMVQVRVSILVFGIINDLWETYNSFNKR
jgi:hypothetical protein